MGAGVSVSYDTQITVTEAQFRALQIAYDHFNETLFEGTLPTCLLTLQRSQVRTQGFFTSAGFIARHGSEAIDEIALNPRVFEGRSDEAIFSTLVHEMVHLWQSYFGRPTRGGYHNREWAAKMKVIGLQPSDTGEPGGKEVGQKMHHFVIAGGQFQLAVRSLPQGVCINWQAREETKERTSKRRPSKLKFTCPSCGANVWGKPGLKLTCENTSVCAVDRQPFIEADPERQEAEELQDTRKSDPYDSPPVFEDFGPPQGPSVAIAEESLPM